MKIKCPNCNEEFEIEEAIEEKLKDEVANKAKAEISEELQKKYEKKIKDEERKREEIIEQKILTEKEKARIEAENNSKDIIEEIKKRAQLKEREYEEKLSQTRKALKDAQVRSDQGSGQQKGEALELTLEEDLKKEFPLDEVVEIKKGQAGGDVSHVVKNKSLHKCGVILYECKNAKWKTEWIDKLKKDVRDMGANIGVLVSLEVPDNFKQITQEENHIFIVRPHLAIVFAGILRNELITLRQFTENTKLKEEKMENLYQYLVGPEFRSRIESMVDGYDKLLKELEKEKKAVTQRWARQEKAISQMRESIFYMHGDLQGISGGEIEKLEDKDKAEETRLTVESLLSDGNEE